MRKKSEILEIMEIFNRDDPNPRCELNYSNAYTLLVAVVLSAQTTDKGVNRATAELFKVADTPQKMVELGEQKLISYIRTIGLFNNKAKNIISMSKDLLERFGGEVPELREDLETLAGVGRKTANVVLNVWYHKPALAVDTHVMRISHRLDMLSMPITGWFCLDVISARRSAPNAKNAPYHHIVAVRIKGYKVRNFLTLSNYN